MNASLSRNSKITLVLALDERLRRARVALADKAQKDFFTFFRNFAWPVLEPGTQYVDNWHIHALCEHLQAITAGEMNRLIVNIPFRQLKSTIISQAWPAWEWIQQPSLQYLTGSYARDLSVRDAVNSRRIIESPAYQSAFGDRFQMTSDQNVKSRYENSRRGTRFATSTDSAATGFGGNRIIVDDPISAQDANSEAAIASSIEWFKGTISTRFNNPQEDACVVVHQRLHEQDLTGFLLREQQGVWEHLIFPMRYERTRQVYVGALLQDVPTDELPTKIGYVDPRTKEGELLNPKRLGEEAVAAMEKALGKYHTDAQLQQRPASRGGTIFARKDWKFYKALPTMEEYIISVDAAFKDLKTSDYVAIQVWGRKGADKFLVKRIRDHLGFGATVNAVRSVRAAMSSCAAILIEDKANGTAIIETLKKELSAVIAVEPEGGKVARAFAIQPEHEAGNLWLPDPSIDPTIEEFIQETASFPNVPHDDETDSMTQAINWLTNRVTTIGMLEYYRQEQARLEQEKQNGGR